ncbi:MAG: hypothetical protein ITG07_02450 [Candidimonas sp.]|nr:hypothetical protein [Candidimonas sp.]
MSDMQTMRDMLQEAMALIETVVTTRYDPRKVADLNRRAYALMRLCPSRPSQPRRRMSSSR